MLSALWWTIYLVVPVAGWGFCDGLPLAPLEAAALAGVWWLGAFKLLPGTRVAAVAVAIKLAALFLIVPHGFAATYYANAAFAPPHESALHFRNSTLTRTDALLAFGGPGRPDLPLHFFNDFTRFNFYQRGDPDRRSLPFSVAWQGFVLVEDGEREQAFYLTGSAVAAELLLDGSSVLRLNPGAGSVSAAAFYPKGWRRLEVRVAGQQGAARDFEAGMVTAGQDAPLGQVPVFAAPITRLAMRVDRAARVLSVTGDAALLLLLTGLCVRRARHLVVSIPARHAVLALGWFAAVGEALWYAWPFAGRVVIQLGGDDPLTYETQARDIVLNGPLMLMGGTAGHAEAFYYQPLYSYVLALMHGLFGEDLFGVVFVQRLLLFATLICVWWLSDRLFGARTARCSLAVALVFLYLVVDQLSVEPWARRLWTETVFVPLIAAWTCAVVAVAASPGLRAGVIAGLAGGLAVLSRSTVVLALAIVPLLLAAARRRLRHPWQPVALMIVTAGAVVSMATVRNWVASGTFVPLTTSFAVNLYLGNTPPGSVPVHAVTEHRFYEWFARDDRTRIAVEFARHEPREFARNLGRKALYALGFFEPLVTGAGVSVALMVTWIAALAGVIIGLRDAEAWAARLLPLAVSASLFAAVVLIFPSHARLILPIYVMLLPYAAVTLERVTRPWFASWS
ncbi:MAG: glycosyltransferase family 39 protein [Vicinamibacterales bacterium]